PIQRYFEPFFAAAELASPNTFSARRCTSAGGSSFESAVSGFLKGAIGCGDAETAATDLAGVRFATVDFAGAGAPGLDSVAAPSGVGGRGITSANSGALGAGMCVGGGNCSADFAAAAQRDAAAPATTIEAPRRTQTIAGVRFGSGLIAAEMAE